MFYYKGLDEQEDVLFGPLCMHVCDAQGVSTLVSNEDEKGTSYNRISHVFLTGGGWEEPLECGLLLTPLQESLEHFRESRSGVKRNPLQEINPIHSQSKNHGISGRKTFLFRPLHFVVCPG